jgi:cell division protein FtsI/penicillin-binding protein 2
VGGVTRSGAPLHLGGRRRRVAPVVVATVLFAAVVAGAVAWWLARPAEATPRDAAEALAVAWSSGDPAAGPVSAPAQVAEAYPALVEELGAVGVAVEVVEVAPTGDDGADGAEDAEVVTAGLSVTWDLGEGRTFEYDTAVALREHDEGWLADFGPAVVHPSLGDDGRFGRRRLVPPRADILGQGGAPLVTERPVVHVGVEPRRVQDLPALTSTLASLVEVDAASLAARVEAAAEDAFVPVITLREEAYLEQQAALQPLPGTVFRRDARPLGPTRDFARPVLGAAGEVTAELVEQHPDRYQAGDLAGLSGLQRRFDERLAGTTGFEVVAVRGDGEVEVLHTEAPQAGAPVHLTIDERVQLAAEAVLAGVEHASALVAVRVSDGQVLAAANGPGNAGVDLALSGRFPPGSTFKVVTTAALLAGGLDPAEVVPCPGTATVDGRPFRNAEQQALGDVPFRAAFAQSCNTAFVGLAARLDDAALHHAGLRFGLGLDHDLGVGAFRGEVPQNDSAVDKSAASIGQGRNLVSPLALADVAATVARGHHLTPELLLEPPAPEPGPPAQPLDPGVAETLRELMRAVVTEGTGSAAVGVGGEPVHGKTGTAEYGQEVPPRTHAWFIAYQGDLAVSVLVAETLDGFGGRLAAPVAADFLSRLAG